MNLYAKQSNAELNATTGEPASRASKIMSAFDFDPKIVSEVYDAVLVAKGKGQSETAVFEQFAQKYNIGSALKAEIKAKMASTVGLGATDVPSIDGSSSRASNIMSAFTFDPKIVGEIYDAVLVAKGKGQSESAVFDKFAQKYNIGADLRAEIEAKMASAA